MPKAPKAYYDEDGNPFGPVTRRTPAAITRARAVALSKQLQALRGRVGLQAAHQRKGDARQHELKTALQAIRDQGCTCAQLSLEPRSCPACVAYSVVGGEHDPFENVLIEALSEAYG